MIFAHGFVFHVIFTHYLIYTHHMFSDVIFIQLHVIFNTILIYHVIPPPHMIYMILYMFLHILFHMIPPTLFYVFSHVNFSHISLLEFTCAISDHNVEILIFILETSKKKTTNISYGRNVCGGVFP